VNTSGGARHTTCIFCPGCGTEFTPIGRLITTCPSCSRIVGIEAAQRDRRWRAEARRLKHERLEKEATS